jgi:cystathionine beta-lyase/cystathionine gamma-synthase
MKAGVRRRRSNAPNVYQSRRPEACVTPAVSLGIRTLIEHPGSMTHSAIPAEEQVAKGLDPGGVRLAVGLEKPEDIIKDLAQSLDATR